MVFISNVSFHRNDGSAPQHGQSPPPYRLPPVYPAQYDSLIRQVYVSRPQGGGSFCAILSLTQIVFLPVLPFPSVSIDVDHRMGDHGLCSNIARALHSFHITMIGSQGNVDQVASSTVGLRRIFPLHLLR